ncbi:hypothetical protein SSX86_015457 [Deinandra increscens subsp. villosa]|uniref:Uncharacterized protein n=1 Tax=Deinandra increscens subsp. villosa TaxID=3103831 RepID=A0AAP0CZU8_9ASTR
MTSVRLFSTSVAGDGLTDDVVAPATRRFKNFERELKAFRHHHVYTKKTDDVVAPATRRFKNFERELKAFRHHHVYTKKTKVLVLNEDNFGLSKWVHDNFVGAGMIWAATSLVGNGDTSLNNDGRLTNMKCLRVPKPPAEKTAAEENGKTPADNVEELEPPAPEMTPAERRAADKKKRNEVKEKKRVRPAILLRRCLFYKGNRQTRFLKPEPTDPTA